jgi:hypothetical protein
VSENIVRATHEGFIKLGEIEIACAVLEDGTRIITKDGLNNFMIGMNIASERQVREFAENLGKFNLKPKDEAPMRGAKGKNENNT